MNPRLLFVVAIGACALLAGCGDQPPKSGYVYAKEHTDAYSYTTLNCVVYGQYGCSAWVPITWDEPAHWRLCLAADNKEDHKGCLDVGEQTWLQYETGQHYPDPR